MLGNLAPGHALEHLDGNAIEINTLDCYDLSHQAASVQDSACLCILSGFLNNDRDCRMDPPKPVGAEVVQRVQLKVTEDFFVVRLGLVIAISVWQITARIFSVHFEQPLVCPRRDAGQLFQNGNIVCSWTEIDTHR
ncbi:MAG: hypothetical protein H8D34_30950 [Chloroflexi bacterium]|nr:hypothetical protein [Chloroflexota bacterium]